MVGSYESTNCPSTNWILSDDFPGEEEKRERGKDEPHWWSTIAFFPIFCQVCSVPISTCWPGSHTASSGTQPRSPTDWRRQLECGCCGAYRFVSSLPTMSPIFGQCMKLLIRRAPAAARLCVEWDLQQATKGIFSRGALIACVFLLFSASQLEPVFFCGWTTRTYGSVAHHGNVTLLGWHLRVRLARSLTMGGCNRFFANKNSADVIPD